MYQKYFDILELKPDCSIVDLKYAFRRKAKQYHPDLNTGENSSEKFIEVNEAYLILNKLLFEPKSYENADNVRKWYNEEKQKARAQAYQYAKMKYEEYKNSRVYKATRLFNPIFYILALPFGLFMFTSPIIFISIRLVKHVPIPPENYVALAGFSIIGAIAAIIIARLIKDDY